MTTLMKHPLNGWTHAYGEGDIKRLEGLGWAVDEPVIVPEPEEAIVLPVTYEWRDSMIPAVSFEDDEMTPAKRGPGRPRKAK